jgi:hypothetical protein
MKTRLALASAAGLVTIGAVTAVLVPTGADAAGLSAESAVNAVAAETAVAPALGQHKRLLTREQRQQLRRDGHLVITRDTPRHGRVTIAVQLGTVTAVGPTSVTLKSKDGYVHSYTITDKTRVRVRRQPAALSDVAVGSKAAVVALVTPEGDQARRVAVRRAVRQA